MGLDCLGWVGGRYLHKDGHLLERVAGGGWGGGIFDVGGTAVW